MLYSGFLISYPNIQLFLIHFFSNIHINGIHLKKSDIACNVLGKPWTIGQDCYSGYRTNFYNGIIDEVRFINSKKM